MKKTICLVGILLFVMTSAALAAISTGQSSQITAVSGYWRLVESELFKKDSGNATISIMDGLRDASNRYALFLGGKKGHWIEWEVLIPATAKYKLGFRYSNTFFGTVFREVTIDGGYPHEACRRIAWTYTGFTSKNANKWRNLLLSDPNKNPVYLTLTQGTHLIRLTNLDWMEEPIPQNSVSMVSDGGSVLDCIGFLGENIGPETMGIQGADN